MVIWELALCGGSVALALALAAFARLLYCERLRRDAGAAAIVLLRERCRRHRAWLGLLPSLRPCIPPFPSVLSSQPIACQLVQNSHPASSVLSEWAPQIDGPALQLHFHSHELGMVGWAGSTGE